MTTLTINRGEKTNIPFSITDAANGLAASRVTWALSLAPNGAPALKKIGGLPGSSADVTIATQTAGSITGTINLGAADLGVGSYFATLWVDDGAGNDRCVSPGGFDTVVVQPDVSRT
jgi:hypothetical protein